MTETTAKKGSDQDLPPIPAKDASPDEWREYHRALFESGKLPQPQPMNQ